MDSQNTAEKSELKQDTLCDSIDLQIQSQMKFKGCVNIQNSRAWECGGGGGGQGVERGIQGTFWTDGIVPNVSVI